MGTSGGMGLRRNKDGRRPHRLARPVSRRHVRSALRPAFTLAELMVSVTVLLVLMTMVGWIFSTATRATTKATANNELMNNVRAAQNQFGLDLEPKKGFGILRDRFIGIWYQLTPDPRPPVTNPPRYLRTDRIVFFTAGGQSCTIRQTDLNTPPMPVPSAGVMRVFYGQEINALGRPDVERWTLARRSKLLVSQTSTSSYAVPPAYSNFALPADGIDASNALWDGNQDLFDNWEYEFETLDDWHNNQLVPVDTFFQLAPPYLGLMAESTTNATVSWIRRPLVNPSNDPARQVGMHMLFLPGCVEFKVQRWITHDPITGTVLGPNSPSGMPRWYPEEDPDGDGWANQIHASGTANGDFVAMQAAMAGTWPTDIREYFNGPPPATSANLAWHGLTVSANPNSTPWYGGVDGRWLYYPAEDDPSAIKITMRVMDPNKRLADGQLVTMTFVLQSP